MFNEIAPILAFMAGNKENKEQNNAISHYLYRLQRGQAPGIEVKRYGQEIAEQLGKSIQSTLKKIDITIK